MIIIPELILFTSLKNALKAIRLDYNNATDKNKTLLYRLLYGLSAQRYKMFDQAVEVFVTAEDSPRNLDINLFFNLSKLSVPSIHITLPNENTNNNGLGIDEGFYEPLTDGDKMYIRYTRRFSASYNIIITSDNTNEVVLIYHLMRAVLISLMGHFNVSGLESVKLGGGDLNINNDLVPPHIFTRAISFSCDYQVEAIDLFSQSIAPADIIFEGVIPIVPNS